MANLPISLTISIFDILPIECIYNIVYQIYDPRTFKNISQSCKIFYSICAEPKTQNNAKDRMKKKFLMKETHILFYPTEKKKVNVKGGGFIKTKKILDKN